MIQDVYMTEAELKEKWNSALATQGTITMLFKQTPWQANKRTNEVTL